MGRTQRVLLVGLGLLWLLDGLLQLQPPMFTPAMLSGLWAPVAQGNPQWLADLVNWSIGIAQSWLPLFNSLVAVTQLVIGAMLLSRRTKLVQIGLWGSLIFGLAVWIFGEGMGGVFAGGASILTGAPGSALLYSIGSALVLAPAASWRRLQDRWAFDPLQICTAVLLLAGTIWQCAGPNWTGFGLSAPAANDFMMPQPVFLRAALGTASGVAMAAPVITNAVLVAALLLASAAVLFASDSILPMFGVLVVLAVIWVCGQDAGMLFSGGATDPNTMPLLALFVFSSWKGQRAPDTLLPRSVTAG